MELTTKSSNQWLPRKKQSFPHIPEDILVNIFPILPVKSVLRFMCVSKLWFRLISETKTHRQKLLFMSDRADRRLMYAEEVFMYLFSTVDRTQWVKQIGKYEPPIARRGDILHFMGSCNGLVLIREETNLILWNPTTRYCKQVLYHKYLCNDGFRAVSGLCYDRRSNSYKAILSLDYDSPSCAPEKVMVGSCRTKRWKEIKFPYKISNTQPGPVFNNHLHWFSSSEYFCFSPPHYIIYFDASRDKFVNLPMPEPMSRSGDVMLSLGVLDGCLCMTRFEEPGKVQGTAQVLVMKEYGVKESWTLLFKVNDVEFCSGGGGLEPYFYLEKKGKVLMKVYGIGFGHDLVAYDSKNNRSTKVADLNDYGDAIVFQETFVRPEY